MVLCLEPIEEWGLSIICKFQLKSSCIAHVLCCGQAAWVKICPLYEHHYIMLVHKSAIDCTLNHRTCPKEKEKIANVEIMYHWRVCTYSTTVRRFTNKELSTTTNKDNHNEREHLRLAFHCTDLKAAKLCVVQNQTWLWAPEVHFEKQMIKHASHIQISIPHIQFLFKDGTFSNCWTIPDLITQSYIKVSSNRFILTRLGRNMSACFSTFFHYVFIVQVELDIHGKYTEHNGGRCRS